MEKEKIQVDIYYGKVENNDEFGITFFFDNMKEAKKFLSIVSSKSNCNAKLSIIYNFFELEEEKNGNI